MQIGGDALPEDSPVRRFSPAARLVLADVFEHLGASVGEISERTGLPPDHVSTVVSRLADEGVVDTVADQSGGQRILAGAGRGAALRDDSAPQVGEALATAVGTGDPERVSELVAILESLARQLNAGGALRGPADFNASYSGTPPWDIGRPQHAFAELAEAGAIHGKVLDVGCGTGEHALMAASLGLPAVGVDAAPAAIEIADRKAGERGAAARFVVHDALRLDELGEQFDTVLDSGLFHVFGDDDRARYVGSLRAVIPPGGRYFMLCFSDLEPPGYGPRRISQDEIRASFADGWQVDAIDAATLEVTINPAGVRAWRAAITRT
jgi:SAM-dependent methyltransferase